MKQRLLLIFVFCLFLLTWGSVAYQVFLKQTPLIMYATDHAKVLVNEDFERGLVREDVTLEEAYQENLQVEVFKTQTEKNKQTNPPLEKGIYFGEGISVDDLLKSFGLAISN